MRRAACLAAALLLWGGMAGAAPETLTCRFPARARALIQPEITLRSDRTGRRIRVEDALIEAGAQGPRTATVEVIRRNRVVVRRIHRWRVDNIPYALDPTGYRDFALRVEPDGRAFLETLPTVIGRSNRAETARGRCS